MRFINLVDVWGKRHVVNPLHIIAIDESDAGCIVHLRGRGSDPIVLSETVEVMAGALDACGPDTKVLLESFAV